MLLVAVLLFTGVYQCNAWTRQMNATNYELTWVVSSNSITFTMSANTTGWVGLGISPAGGMTNADITIGWVSNGTVYLEDRLARANQLPEKDAVQNLNIVNGTEVNGWTTITFSRMLTTTDSDMDVPITEDSMFILHAFGTADPMNNAFSSSDYHNQNRGTFTVLLLEPPLTTNWPTDTVAYDFTVDVTIPSAETTYYCSLHRPPTVSSKRHVIAYEPIIQPGNEFLVHHINVYACYGVTNATFFSNQNRSLVCMMNTSPDYASSCRTIAFSGAGFVFPENVGYAIGDDLAPTYYMLEIHYNNPFQIYGKHDSSGLRIYHTAELRANDAGFLQTGQVFGIFVPPNAKSFESHGYCSADCTNEWIPDGGITAFAYLSHAHLLGTAIKARWFRNGQEMEPFANTPYFNFNFQGIRRMHEEKKIYKGDTLDIQCTYDSTGRASVTYGGLATSDEMCLFYVLYYPRASISNCETVSSHLFYPNSSVWTKLALHPQGITLSQVPLIVYFPQETLSAVSWSNDKIASASDASRTSQGIIQCYQSGRVRYKSQDTLFSSPYSMAPPTMIWKPFSALIALLLHLACDM